MQPTLIVYIPPWVVLAALLGLLHGAIFHLLLGQRLGHLPRQVAIGLVAGLLGGLAGTMIPPAVLAIDKQRQLCLQPVHVSCATFLAARGFVVDAIDISPTAIALARRFAAERGLTISFAVGDIARLEPTDATYDLVVDNYCLQHLVPDDERRHAARRPTCSP